MPSGAAHLHIVNPSSSQMDVHGFCFVALGHNNGVLVKSQASAPPNLDIVA